MASFQVEMAAPAASSSSPFGCVLRDRNRCNGDHHTTTATATNSSKAAAAAFQKNLKVLVRDHLHTRISVSPDENENLAEPTAPSNSESARTTNNNSSSTRMSSRQARNLDRWAAKQAEQMVSTIERQSQEAEELWVVASSNPSTSSCSKKENENCVISSQSSIAESECSSQIGASSLVQIWEARMNQPKPKPLHSRSSSISSMENLADEPSRHSDVCPLDTVSNHDLLTDWVDSAVHATASSHRHSDVGADGEKVRIADIIRRLTCEVKVHDHHNPESMNLTCDTPRRHSSCDPPEHRGGWSLVVSSPRIRGRQAFHDLLVHIEQDRHKELGSLAERHAVSKFCYRGRIQSLLKLRFLRRDMGIPSRPVPPPPASRPPQHSSSIMQLRERLRASLEQVANSEREAIAAAARAENRCRKIDTISSTQNQSRGESQPQGKVPPPMEDQPCPVVEVANVEQQQQDGRQEEHHVELRTEESDKKETEQRVEEVVENHHVEEQCSCPQVEENTVAETRKETSDIHVSNDLPIQNSVDAWQERYLECAMGEEDEEEAGEGGDVEGEGEEEEEEDEQEEYFEEAPYDWFSEIARPRSYWEDMRQSWYNEMLSNGNGNRDIKELLERKTVSSFLASDFRERIDRLMMSRARIQSTEEPQESDVEETQEKMAQLALSYFRRENGDGLEDGAPEKPQQQQPVEDDDDKGETEEETDEDGETEEETEEDESSSSSSSTSSSSSSSKEEESEEEYMDQEEHQEESITSRQFVEANDLFDRASHQSSIFSASPFRPWQSVDDYERLSSVAHSQQNRQSSFNGSHNQERRCSCCARHGSIDVDVVNELRGNMVELRSEVAELKKLVQSCIEMQMNFMRVANPPTSFQ